jgi:fructokinase
MAPKLGLVWIVGEALIDLIPDDAGNLAPRVGGGPANTAKAIARLGFQVSFIGGISSDSFGQLIEDELKASGVALELSKRSNRSTALAITSLDKHGAASYEFKLEGTATFAFHHSWLPQGEPDVLHVGSVATIVQPGAIELLKWASLQSAPIIFDPNVRPSIEGDRDKYRKSVERWIDVASIVKLSQEDLEWLYGDESIINNWLNHGVSLVVITRGDKGLSALGHNIRFDVPAVPVSVIDTIGAGDTIGAVIVEGVLEYGLSGLSGENLFKVLERAVRAAAITCSRAGANPPWKAELDKL